MNSKERVLAALRGEQPDRVPIVDLVDQPSLVSLATILQLPIPQPGDPFAEQKLASQLVLKLGMDGIIMPEPLDFTAADEDLVSDRFGSVYHTSPHGDEPLLVAGPIASLADMQGFDMKSVLTHEDFDVVGLTRDLLGPAYPLMMWLASPFKLSWRLRGGMQQLLTDYVRQPALVHALSRVTSDLVIAEVEAAAEAGIDVIMLAGDIAGEDAPLFSLRHFREYLRPYYEEIVAAAHGRGVPVIYHSDGNMWPFMDDLIEIGFDGNNPMQPQCMDIGEVKEKFGDRICLVGNIDCRDLLCFSSEDDVARAVKETIAVAAPRGGYMLSSSNSIHPDVRPQNFLAMVRAAQRYGGYSSRDGMGAPTDSAHKAI